MRTKKTAAVRPSKKAASGSDPLWYKDAIIYEIHVRSFFDGNNDGIGDFAGLIQKLDYLQGLGVNCLWLLPFYPSPLRDDGYDIADYEGIHPAYGTPGDFRRFVREAHRRGLRVITELVINHTSDQHPWFQAARRAPAGSAKRNFYVWSDSDEKYKGARIIFTDSEKSNWTWDPVAQAYYWHRFFHHQPDLNFDNPRVRSAVMKTMRHWLDMGVDGLRLDAVPYLVEREGTNCENLPETHAILKTLRKHLDARYKDRMFLAEANQWPSDVRAYFGDGDECHMAFHFPLMPRIFMALRQEDRHPITEIMRQTPEIPANCQWALFLRNHDELTLEMVTSEERDYMYNEYASEAQMRLNIGIRRRLAPLLGRSRRRLELLNSFLLSFPGTPVIYYGDEIAMGDNIFLGDRNGVRTPMQWTGDRNAGFSQADPARLFCPPVMDPVYGYQAINVDAQERDPSSLLNWIKRMIALRRRMKVFSRGSIEFIYPQNRKILAYVRRYEDETILAVANLSRFVQPAELDLSAFKGHVPVELMGRVKFPVVGDLPYFLTLAPHSFYWFQMQKPAAAAGPEQAPSFSELPALQASGADGWRALFTGNAKRQLEAELLPKFLMRQRWFGGKARKPISVRIADWGEIKGGPAPSFFVTLEAEFASGAAETYMAPLSVATGAGAEALARNFPGAVVARLTGSDRPAILHDAFRDDATCNALFEAIRNGRDFKTANGTVRAEATAAFREILRADDVLPFKPAVGPAEQNNTSVLFGERFILKMFRRLQPGVNPDYEIGRYLTDEAGFKNVPRLGGGLRYERPDGSSATLGILHELMENQGSGWQHALNELGRYFERVSVLEAGLIPPDFLKRSPVSLAKEELPPPVGDALGGYLQAAATLGRRTAELHRVFSQNAADEAFLPEPFTAADAAAVCSEMRETAQKTLRALEHGLGRLPDAVRDQAHRILSERARLLDRFKPPKFKDVPAGRTRVHGDYHLGQVLWVENDFVILDFKGEPSRPPEGRRAKQSPLKDVAGMLGSFDYAARSALARHVQDRPEGAASLSAWAALWRQAVSAAFLRGYLAEAGNAAFIPGELAELEALLNIYSLDKALHELQYELNSRPDGVHVPLEKIISFL